MIFEERDNQEDNQENNQEQDNQESSQQENRSPLPRSQRPCLVFVSYDLTPGGFQDGPFHELAAKHGGVGVGSGFEESIKEGEEEKTFTLRQIDFSFDTRAGANEFKKECIEFFGDKLAVEIEIL